MIAKASPLNKGNKHRRFSGTVAKTLKEERAIRVECGAYVHSKESTYSAIYIYETSTALT